MLKHSWAHWGTAEVATGPQSAVVAGAQELEPEAEPEPVVLTAELPGVEVGTVLPEAGAQEPPDGGAEAQAQTLLAPAMTLVSWLGGQAVSTQGRRSADSEDWASGWHWQA